MSKAVEPASFEDFLGASDRLSGIGAARGVGSSRDSSSPTAKRSSAPGAKRAGASFQKVKVGLTIDEGLVDAVDDYIYHVRKQGRRLKKNDVYETALRQFLETEGIDVR